MGRRNPERNPPLFIGPLDDCTDDWTIYATCSNPRCHHSCNLGRLSRIPGGKAEHNVASLSKLLGVGENEVRPKIKPLVELGFLEEISDKYKVPMLYRGGLEITQGKAFASNDQSEEDM